MSLGLSTFGFGPLKILSGTLQQAVVGIDLDAFAHVVLECRQTIGIEGKIDEARLAGADAILLLVAALDSDSLNDLHDHAMALGLDVLVEVHDDDELDCALAMGARLIGVNNRDLRTFDVDLGITERLAARIDDSGVVLIAESGIGSPKDVARLERAGAMGFLVGESLMRQPDPGEALQSLRRPL